MFNLYYLYSNTNCHTAATFPAEKDSCKEGSPLTRRTAALYICLVGGKALLVFLEFFPGDISLVMTGEEYFPVFFVWETDGVVFEMPVGINGFIVTIAPIHIRPGIGRIVDDAEDAAVGERSPCDLPIPCASISALGERKVVFGEYRTTP